MRCFSTLFQRLGVVRAILLAVAQIERLLVIIFLLVVLQE